MKILTGSQQVIVRSAGGLRAFVERMVAERWGAAVNWTTRGTVRAVVIRSAWAAPCPFCAGALVVEPGEPYFCPDCAMQGNGFRAMAVIFPANRGEIEAALVARPDPSTRNWTPGETVADLWAENRAHGIGGEEAVVWPG